LTTVMSFTSMSIIMAVIILYVHQKSKRTNARRLPKFMRKIFIEKIALYLGLTKQVDMLIKRLEKREKNIMRNKSVEDILSTSDNLSQVESEMANIWQLKDSKKTRLLKNSNCHSTYSLKYPSTRQESKTKTSINKNKESLSYLISHEWLLFSLVLDRFFFYIFIVLTILSYLTTLYILPTLIQSDKNESKVKVF